MLTEGSPRQRRMRDGIKTAGERNMRKPVARLKRRQGLKQSTDWMDRSLDIFVHQMSDASNLVSLRFSLFFCLSVVYSNFIATRVSYGCYHAILKLIVWRTEREGVCEKMTKWRWETIGERERDRKRQRHRDGDREKERKRDKSVLEGEKKWRTWWDTIRGR